MRQSMVLFATVGCLVVAGCRDETEPPAEGRAGDVPAVEASPRNTLSKPEGGRALSDTDSAGNRTTDGPAAEANTDASAEQTVIPRVLLTQSHAAMCRVLVGDVLPPLRLADLDGTEHDVSSLFGEKLTVVFFWTGERSSARTGLADLDPDVATPYKDKGVRVVGIAVQESAPEVERHIDEADATFVNLLDPDGSAFAQVGTGMLPRIFVVDSHGEILWFDVEYSRSTRRELRQAICSVVGEPEA